MNDEYGLLVEGFDAPPAVMMPYNPPYYAALLEGCGLRKAKDLYAFRGAMETTLDLPKMQRANDVFKRRSGLTYRSLAMKDFPAEIERIKGVYNRAWEDNWGAVPMTDEEFDALAKDLKLIVRPELVVIAEAAGGDVAGFGLALPDINMALRDNRNGGLLRGLWHLLSRRSRIDRIRILVCGVLPEYRRTGAAGVIFHELASRARALGYRRGEASWILEDNTMMIRAAEAMAGVRERAPRVYQGSDLSMLKSAVGLLLLIQVALPASAPAETLLWTRTYVRQTPGDAEGLGVAVGPDGSVSVTGRAYVEGQGFDLVLRKYSASGGLLWARRLDGPAHGHDRGASVAVGADGSVYFAGDTGIAGHGQDLLLRKYSAAGGFLWARTYGGAPNEDDAASGVAIGPDGSVYVTGHTPGAGQRPDLLLQKYSAAGNHLWTRTYNGVTNGADRGESVAVGRDGSVYVTGVTDEWVLARRTFTSPRP